MMTMLPPRLSAIEEWEQAVRLISTNGEQIVQTLSRANRLYEVNKIEAKIASTEEDALVEGSSFSKQHAQAIVMMLESFQNWLSTPLAEGGPTPEQIMFSR